MKKGFTLIELLVTISIISILMGLMLVAFNGTKSVARDGRRKADLTSIGSALEMYRQDNAKYPTVLTTLTSANPPYMTSPLADPLATQLYAYSPTPVGCNNIVTNCTGYYLCAKLELGTSTAPNCASVSCGVACNYQVLNP